MKLARLWMKDGVLRFAALFCAAFAVVLCLPLFSPALLATFGDYVADPVLIALALYSFSAARRSTAHLEERRFWGWLMAAFGFWLLAPVTFVIRSQPGQDPLWMILTDGVYAALYVSIFLAIDTRPHHPSGWSTGNPVHLHESWGSGLFVFCLFIYAVAIPRRLSPEEYLALSPSLLTFGVLDAVMLGRLLIFRTQAPEPRWKTLYGVAACAVGLLCFNDLREFVTYLLGHDMPRGGALDILWYPPLLAFLLLGRAAVQEWPHRGEDQGSPASRYFSGVSVSGGLVVYAFLIPVLHFALYAAGLLDPVSRAAREIALLIFMAALGGIVIREHFALQKWNRRLRAELDAAQDHLQQSRKMEAVGRLAGGVAHDFNNLLMIIRGYSELLLDQASTPGLMRSGIEQIHSAADRAAALTRQLLAFSRKQVIAPEAVHLDEVVRGLEPLLSRLIGENIELAARHAPGLWPVRADRSQVEQIILNLAANGRDAMPSGGRLTLATRNVSAQESTTFAGLAPRDYALLEVSDTGMGMDAETQARAFEPFFTTKTAGKGTGLGLATVYAIVQQADGASFLESHPGRGTTLRVFLPRTITAAAPERAAPRESAGVGSGTVLLVEDEHGVRRLAREFLESSGYTVLEAGNGTEALEMADGYAGSIDLMVTDVIMPGMNGRELAERLVARRPTTKVLFVSGHTDDAVMQQGVFESSMEFLQKPFTKAGLAEKVYKVLHG